jgi:hypothetical protein
MVKSYFKYVLHSSFGAVCSNGHCIYHPHSDKFIISIVNEDAIVWSVNEKKKVFFLLICNVYYIN